MDRLQNMTIEKPLVLEDLKDVEWSATADVIIVGQGGAGLCAALEARAHGATALAIDRFGGGGATAYSGGIFYAGDTRYQKEAGISDSKEEMYKYLEIELETAIKPSTLRRYCNGSSADIDWLASHGVPFSGAAYLEKTAYPPEDKFLYYSGNENVAGYREKAMPAPRGHRTVGTGFSGYAYYAALSQAADKAGVERMMHTRAARLVIDRAGVVIGLEVIRIEDPTIQADHARYAKQVNPMKPFNAEVAETAIVRARELEAAHGRRHLLRATRGVILAAGGFTYDLELLNRHLPIYGQHVAALIRMGSIGCDGSGIRLGESAGGTAAYMDSLYSARILSPPKTLLNGILVNQRGDRFVNEEIYAGYLGRSIGRQTDGLAWLIIDRSSYWKAIRECFTAGWTSFRWFTLPTLMNIFLGRTKRARTLERLAAKCGISRNGLLSAIKDYNEAIETSAPDPMGKKTRKAIVRGAFYAIDMSIGGKYGFTMVITLGGLRVSEETGNVIRSDGSVIQGLYAAGRTAAGLCAIGYFSGMSLSDGVFSGRRAGAHAAQCRPESTRSHSQADVAQSDLLRSFT
jgi:3-oxo-5alpha-steroid 4-dehydrogenase